MAKSQFGNGQIKEVMEKRGCNRKAALRWLNRNREDRPKGKAAVAPTPSAISRDWNCTKYSRQRRHVRGRFAAKNAPAGQRQIRTISVRRIQAGHWDDYLPAPASASGSGKRRPGEVQVSAACCADLFWTDRGSLPLLTPWPWYRPVPVAAVPIPPCPATRGRRA